MTTFQKENQWKYLESCPESWQEQLYIKGEKIKVSDIYSEMILKKETLEEAAKNRNLPLAAIQEVIEYCQIHRELLKEEAQDKHHRLIKNQADKKRFYQTIEWFLIFFLIIILVLIVQTPRN